MITIQIPPFIVYELRFSLIKYFHRLQLWEVGSELEIHEEISFQLKIQFPINCYAVVWNDHEKFRVSKVTLEDKINSSCSLEQSIVLRHCIHYFSYSEMSSEEFTLISGAKKLITSVQSHESNFKSKLFELNTKIVVIYLHVISDSCNVSKSSYLTNQKILKLWCLSCSLACSTSPIWNFKNLTLMSRLWNRYIRQPTFKILEIDLPGNHD